MRPEAQIENRAVDYAKSKGVVNLKLNVRGQIGWPDQLFIYKGKVAFVEFKRPGEEPTVYQLHIHNKLRANGALVYVVDNYDAAKQTIDEIICA